jgi:uncharacterized membrane protein YeaQ/YmgE (transglycosylase-associated protein family)
VAWLVILYIDDSGRRLLGHAFVSTIGAFIGGFLSIRFWSEADKYALIISAFLGAGILLYLVRYRYWHHFSPCKSHLQENGEH